MRTLALTVLAVLVTTVSALGQDPWALADAHTVRLPPSAFPALPRPLQARLEQLGCTVPQTYDEPQPHNVIRGHFRNPRAWDWAVLCSVNGVSRVIVFWGGNPGSVELLGAAPDRDYLQGVGGDSIGFSRVIGVASPRAIRSYHHEFGKGRLPAIDHDGIEDAFEGKASGIAYYYRGRWLTLAGAD